jgi:hypothetical protein
MIGKVFKASSKRYAFKCGVGLFDQQSDKFAFNFCRPKMIDRVLNREYKSGRSISVEYRREQNVAGPTKSPRSVAPRSRLTVGRSVNDLRRRYPTASHLMSVITKQFEDRELKRFSDRYVVEGRNRER